MEIQLNKELVTKWVEALRSGKYKQTKGSLHKGDAFCCLGVLCDITGVQWTERKVKASIPEYVIEYKDESSQGSAWLGLTNSIRNQIGLSFQQECKLANLNDVQSYNFNEIAIEIEKMEAESNHD